MKQWPANNAACKSFHLALGGRIGLKGYKKKFSFKSIKTFVHF